MKTGKNKNLISEQRGALTNDMPARTQICEGVPLGLYGRGNYMTWHIQGIYGHPVVNWGRCGILTVPDRSLP